jgi:hypothetical protein
LLTRGLLTLRTEAHHHQRALEQIVGREFAFLGRCPRLLHVAPSELIAYPILTPDTFVQLVEEIPAFMPALRASNFILRLIPRPYGRGYKITRLRRWVALLPVAALALSLTKRDSNETVESLYA